MKFPSLRNLIIGYSIAVIIVLLIIWITFSSLRSQEKELATISKTREVLQKIQPVFIDLTEFESQLGTILIFNKGNYTDAYNDALKKIKSDSALMIQLAASHPEDRVDYRRLAGLLHNMTAFADYLLDPNNEGKINLPGNTWHPNSGKEIITEFKAIADKLEDASRKTLSASYDNTINLTRRTFDFVKIIAAILILILFISFILIYRDIRAREKKQEALSKFNEELEKKVDEKTAEIRTSEKKYRSVIEQASDAIMVTDEKGNFVEVNTALCKQFDYTREELIGSNISRLIDAEQLKNEPIRFDLLKAGETISRERKMVHKNGTIIEVEANVKMLPDGRIMAIARDITERKKAADIIMKERDLSDSIINSLPGIFYLINQYGTYLRWNKNLETILGYTGEEIRNLPPYHFIAPEDKEAVSEKIERVFKLGENNTIEATAIKKDGGRIPFFLTGGPVTYEDQPCLLGTGIDITERKKAEEALKKSEANLKTIFETTDDGYALMDEKFGIISYNQRGLDFVINELKGSPGASNNLIDFLPPERRVFLSGLKEKVLNGGHVGYEISYPQPDTSLKWYYIRMFPVSNNEKQLLGLMMAVTDITEKRSMEQSMLDQKVQEQKRIIRAVLQAEESERNKIGQELHDNVNQILASVKLYLSMVKEKAGQDALETINQSASLLDNAINEIRSLSKSQVTPLKKIDLKELIQSLIDDLDVSKTITTKFVYTANKKHIPDDLKLNIYRIVQEQINNILKHAKASVVSIVLTEDESELNLSIADNGKGFDPGRKRNGIGVSNMVNRVESFNGKLDIISSPGNGCEIQIRIPC